MNSSHFHRTPALRLIHGDLDRIIRIGTLAIQLAPQERPPFAVSAIAVEQDTALVLDEEPVLQTPHSTLKELSGEMERFREPVPGSVVVQRGKPRRLYAIVHDLEQEPTWREEWVEAALQNLLRLVERQQISALALPLLGNRYGSLSPERFLQMLCSAAATFPPSLPLKLWLVVPRFDVHRLLQKLEHCVAQQTDMV
jgi:hypothetical protein